MAKRLTQEEFLERANKIHNNKYDYSQTKYTQYRDFIDVICPEHGVFNQLASSHLSGNGCPKCAYQYRDETKRIEIVKKKLSMTTDEFKKRASEIHNNKYDYSLAKYENRRSMIKIICPEHGIFVQKADSHLEGHGCALCGIDKVRNSRDYKWSEEQHKKIERTCMERYGAKRYLDSEEGKAKIKKIKSDPVFRAKMSETISSEDVQNKTKRTCFKKYGVFYPSRLEYVQNKIYVSKKNNGTMSSSMPEEECYDLLCEFFGKSDVIRQYKDFARYPFICDFYICSLDLFIELNLHWSHGGGWFNSDDVRCLNKLFEWKRKARKSKFYKTAVEVWTVKDPLKCATAIENDLNYLVFWDNDLSDFKEWLYSNDLSMCNIYE